MKRKLKRIFQEIKKEVENFSEEQKTEFKEELKKLDEKYRRTEKNNFQSFLK